MEQVTDSEELARVLGCRICSLPTTYLGLLLGSPFKSLQVSDVVQERFQKQLAMWKELAM